MRILLLAALLVVALAGPAAAQTHYCDTTNPTSGSAVTGAPVTLSVCHDSKDTNGNTTTLTALALYDNGTRTTPTYTKGTTSASGQTVYTIAFTAPSAAALHTYTIAGINSQGEGPKSAPFALTVTSPLTVPTVPTKLSVIVNPGR